MALLNLKYTVDLVNVDVDIIHRNDGYRLNSIGMSSEDIIRRLKSGEYSIALDSAIQQADQSNIECISIEESTLENAPQWAKDISDDWDYIILEKDGEA